MLGLLPLIIHSQSITGVVLDAETQEPLPFASVYFDATFTGTSTDIDGRFKLDIKTSTNLPLVVSYVGYESLVLTDYETGTEIQILLIPREYEMKEVLVEDESLVKQRRRNLRIFRDQFLGKSRNARRCSILNEEDISFDYSTEKNIIKAWSREPLRIHNKSLGYDLVYDLIEFNFDSGNGNVLYQGYTQFIEGETVTPDKPDKIEKARRQTYEGSVMHFLRSLWSDNLEEDQFTILNENEDVISANNLVFRTATGIRFINYEGILEICRNPPCSKMRFVKSQVILDESGYYDPSAIQWYGPMGAERVSDLLPYDYFPGED